MTGSGLVLLALLVLGYFAVKERAFWNMRRSIEPVSSPFSRALVQLVGVAGGIYLALGLFASFVNLELPDRIKAWGFGLDPLAVAAILLALVQPYLIRLQKFIRKRTI